MSLPEDIDKEKIAEAALAILSLTAHGDADYTRVWKDLDWDLLDLLHDRGWISDPVGKHRSVQLTDAGIKLAQEYVDKHFGSKLGIEST